MLNEMKSAFGGNIKKFLVGTAAGAMLLANAIIPAGAVAPWNVTGEYDITFMLAGDPTPYVHDASLTQTGSSVDGVGGHPANAAHTYEWDVTSGSVVGDAINLTANYTMGAPGTTMNMVGTIAPDGTVTGTWTDNFGGSRNGTWSITAGVSEPRIHTPANGATVEQSDFVKIDWTDAVGSNPPFTYQYQAYSDPGYTVLVYDSGMTLAASEIPTPGTPPGDYYVTVRAQNSAGAMSDWSNDATNPYHIKVVADSINDFPVPAQCDQSVAYNKIEGTNGSNVLNGTSGPDLILAKGGSDIVNGMGGNDCIDGGAGSDALRGNEGNDVILGGADSDSILGHAGNDNLYGEGGSDALNGGDDMDTLSGGAGSDSLRGGANNDTLTGDAGSDAANGNGGTDTCTAEAESQCEV